MTGGIWDFSPRRNGRSKKNGLIREIEVVGANHMSFLDDPNCGLTCSVCATGTDEPDTTRLLTRRYMTAFFNVFLREDPPYLLYLTGSAMVDDVAAGFVTSESKNGF